MSENKFDIADIEPAKVGFIEESTTEEQLPESTLPEESSTEEKPTEVQATADSEEYKNLQAAFTKTSQENSELRNRLNDMEARLDRTPPAPNHQNSFDVPAQQAHVPDELDKVDEEFTELKPVNARIRKLEAQLVVQEARLATQQREYADNTAMTAQQIHDQKILSVHPDAYDIAVTAIFDTEWKRG